MNYSEDYSIIRNSEILEEDYIPPNIPAREPHLQEIRLCLLPLLKKRRPMSPWLYGDPGTGKTTLAKYILEEIQKNAPVQGVYVNCWKYNTFFSVLEFILNELRINFGDERDTRVKMEKFERFVKDKPFLIVLDEIDFMPQKERDSLLYNFCFGRMGLMCISHSRETLVNLESRVRSRLLPQTVEFRPYTVKELVEILRDRALVALHPGSWNNSLLERIAEASDGDARVAIQGLRYAAELAEKEGSERIQTRHIERGLTNSRDLKRKYYLERLTEHHRLLYSLIKSRPGIQSPELWSLYLNKATAKGIEPIAKRTFSHYTSQMREKGLIRADRVKAKGKIYSFRVKE